MGSVTDLYVHFITITGNICIYFWLILWLIGRDTCRIKTLVLFSVCQYHSFCSSYCILGQNSYAKNVYTAHNAKSKNMFIIIMSALIFNYSMCTRSWQYQHNIKSTHFLKWNAQQRLPWKVETIESARNFLCWHRAGSGGKTGALWWVGLILLQAKQVWMHATGRGN